MKSVTAIVSAILIGVSALSLLISLAASGAVLNSSLLRESFIQVFSCPVNVACSLAPAGLVMELTPDVLEKHGLTEDKFDPAVWKRGQFKGKQYAIPLDTHPFVLYYNTDLAKKADLLGEDGRLRQLNGEKEVLDAFSALKKASKAAADLVLPVVK